MKYETLYIMVRVVVHSTHSNISDAVNEIETQSKLSLNSTLNVKVLETEILMTRVRNIKKINPAQS